MRHLYKIKRGQKGVKGVEKTDAMLDSITDKRFTRDMNYIKSIIEKIGY